MSEQPRPMTSPEWKDLYHDKVRSTQALHRTYMQTMAVLEKIVTEWDQYFDAEGPLQPDGGYRWSSQTAAGLIDEARRLIKSAKGEA